MADERKVGAHDIIKQLKCREYFVYVLGCLETIHVGLFCVSLSTQKTIINIVGFIFERSSAGRASLVIIINNIKIGVTFFLRA